MTPILVHRKGVLSHIDNSEMSIASVRFHRTDESESSFESSQTSHPSNNLLLHSVMDHQNDQDLNDSLLDTNLYDGEHLAFRKIIGYEYAR